MGSLLDDIRDGIREGIEYVADKTDEYTKIGKLKVEVLGIKRNIEKQFIELGGRTFELLSGRSKKQVAEDDEVNNLVKELKELEKKLDEKKKQIEKIKAEKEQQRKEREESRKAEAEAKKPDEAK
jgi:hypothetical protein